MRSLVKKLRSIAKVAALAALASGIAPSSALAAGLDLSLLGAAALSSEACVATAYARGRPLGLVLSSIEPGSLYEEVGLQDGDVVLSVNGRAIKGTEEALAAYQALRDEKRFVIEVLRDGERVVLRHARDAA